MPPSSAAPPRLFWNDCSSCSPAWVYQTSQPVFITAVCYLFFVPPGHSPKMTAPWWPQPTPASAPPRESWSTARQPNSAWRRYQVAQVNTYAACSSYVIFLCVGVWMWICLFALIRLSLVILIIEFNLHLLLHLHTVDLTVALHGRGLVQTVHLLSLGNRRIGLAYIKTVALYYGLAAQKRKSRLQALLYC